MDRFAAATLTLVDGDLSIVVRPENPTAADPIACRRWDLGAPEVRIGSIPRPGADGVDETGGYFGSRTVTLELLIRGDTANKVDGHDPYWYAEKLAAMCHPTRRPRLKIGRASETGGTWYLTLRGDPWTLEFDRTSAAWLPMTLSFTAPTGVLESELHTVASATANPVAATDWNFPAAFPHGFGPSTRSPFLTAVVKGSAPVNPILYITGPATNPQVRDSNGQRFEFAGLTLESGQTVRVDMGTGSVLLADAGTSKPTDAFHAVDFNTSDFWLWQPGTHTVALTTTGSFALQWADRQLTI